MGAQGKYVALSGDIGVRQGSVKKNESDILMLRRRQNREFASLEERVEFLEAEIDRINNKVVEVVETPEIDLSLFVKSVPIRDVQLLERVYWEKIQYPRSDVLYLVYDATP